MRRSRVSSPSLHLAQPVLARPDRRAGRPVTLLPAPPPPGAPVANGAVRLSGAPDRGGLRCCDGQGAGRGEDATTKEAREAAAGTGRGARGGPRGGAVSIHELFLPAGGGR